MRAANVAIATAAKITQGKVVSAGASGSVSSMPRKTRPLPFE